MAPVPPARDTGGLERRLGALDATAIVVSSVIGTGIFITPVFVAQAVPHPAGILGVWILGGLLAFAGALAYAELAARYPRAGGEYVYLREAFGPLAAFLTGWTSFIAGFSGAIAAAAVALAGYLGRFLPLAADATPLVTLPLPGHALHVSPQALVALAMIGAVSAVHVCGLGPGRVLQNALAALKVGALVAFAAVGLWVARSLPAPPPPVHAGAGGWMGAFVPMMFTYSGWNAATYVAEEIAQPARNVLRALAAGTALVTVVYVALNVLFLRTLGADGLAGAGVAVVDVTAQRLFGRTLGDAVALFAIVSIAGGLSAMVLAGPRVYFAMARDGLFLPAAARVHPRLRTPAVAIVAQALWSGVLVLAAPLASLVGYTGFAVMLFAGMTMLALFVVRRRAAGDARVPRAWTAAIAPAAFGVASVLMVAAELYAHPGRAGGALLLVALGVPSYLLVRRTCGCDRSGGSDGV